MRFLPRARAKHLLSGRRPGFGGDFLAWIQATMLAAIENDPLFVPVAVTGARLNKRDFMPELSRMLRETTKDLEKREEILSMVKSAIAQGEGAEPSS